MGIILEKLNIENMFSFGKNVEINLHDSKIMQIKAPNGYGKTSFSIIIQELLYSKNVKNIKKDDILNSFCNADSWKGSLDFSIDNNKYNITVIRANNKAKVKLLENGKDISDHTIPNTYKKLEKLLKIPFEIFSQLTYQSSIDLLEFLKATDVNRKRFLINLFNLNKYLEKGEIIKISLAKLEKELILKQGELNSVIDFLKENSILPEKMKLKPVVEFSKDKAEKKAILQQKLNSFKQECLKIDKNNLYIQEQQQIKFSYLEKPNEVVQDKIKLSEINKTLIKYEENIKKIKTDLSSLDLSDICYVCKQKIDNSKNIELKTTLNEQLDTLMITTTNIKQDKKELESIIIKFEEDLKKWQSEQLSIQRFEHLAQLIDSNLPKTYSDFKELETSYNLINKEILEEEQEIKKITEYNSNVLIRNTKIEGLQDQIRAFKARQEILNNDILIMQSKIDKQNILKKAYSPSGLVAYKLENVTKELEEKINYYLSILSDGQFQVIFRLENEKLNIIIINNGIEKTVESLSGGEFSRVQTSILLAVRNTLSSLGGNSVNILFLDEITGVLDIIGKEKLIEVLSEEKDLNVFLISHDFSHPLVPSIILEKDNNITKIAA